MTLTENISKILAKDKIQRAAYSLAFVFWIFIMKGRFESMNATSSIGIKYLWLIAIPAVLLAAQALFNWKLTWAIIFGLIVFYSLYLIFSVIKEFVERSNKPIKHLSFDAATALGLFLIFILLIALNWTVYHLKPNGKR